MRLMEHADHFDLRELLRSTDTPHRTVSHPPQSNLFIQGEASETLIYLEQGTVRLAMSSASGKEAICGILGAGAFLGEGALSGERTHRHTAVTMTPVTVIEVAAASMRRLLHTENALVDRFIAHVLARHANLEADLTDQIISGGEQRLARALLHLAGCQGGDACSRPLPPISQEHLARMVGTTRSRVNAFIGKFKRFGFLEAAGGVLIVNPALREALRDVMAPEAGAHRRLAPHNGRPVAAGLR